jgi:hypothetical protein
MYSRVHVNIWALLPLPCRGRGHCCSGLLLLRGRPQALLLLLLLVWLMPWAVKHPRVDLLIHRNKSWMLLLLLLVWRWREGIGWR